MEFEVQTCGLELEAAKLYTTTHFVHLKTLTNLVEKKIIIEALKRSRGEITSAAKTLGIARTTLTMKCYKFNIQPIIYKGEVEYYVPNQPANPSN